MRDWAEPGDDLSSAGALCTEPEVLGLKGLEVRASGGIRCCRLFVYAAALVILLLSAASPGRAEEKATIGEVEEVMLYPGREKMAARIDTGAATSSLGVCRLKVTGKKVEFTLPADCDGVPRRSSLVSWRYVHSVEGSERRPVVNLEVCIGSKKFRTRVTLTDRSHMEFPFLLGRNTLKKGNFVVDVRRARTSPPSCPGN